MSDDNTQGGAEPSSASAGSVAYGLAASLRDMNDEILARGADYSDILLDAARELDRRSWIPVSERLPDVERSAHGSVECIVACSTGLVTAMRYTENRVAKTEKGRRPRWEWNWRVATWEVTHWMPLPAPPTDSK
jgi:hypothetical protein